MLEKVKFQYILLSAVELPFACFSIHLKGESEIAYVRASILVLSRAYAIEDLFCVTHSGKEILPFGSIVLEEMFSVPPRSTPVRPVPN